MNRTTDDEPTLMQPTLGASQPKGSVLSETGLSMKARRRRAPSLDDGGRATQLIRPEAAGERKAATSRRNVRTGGEEVVGWLVIVEGAGQGADFRIGYGITRIGRGSDTDISLDFGDGAISRGVQLRITADPRSKKFYLQQDGGKNVVYLEGEPLLVPTEIKTGARVLLGETTLLFVAFAPDLHDWTSGGPGD